MMEQHWLGDWLGHGTGGWLGHWSGDGPRHWSGDQCRTHQSQTNMEISAGLLTSAQYLFVTRNLGRQGDATPGLALSELMGWFESEGSKQ